MQLTNAFETDQETAEFVFPPENALNGDLRPNRRNLSDRHKSTFRTVTLEIGGEEPQDVGSVGHKCPRKSSKNGFAASPAGIGLQQPATG